MKHELPLAIVLLAIGCLPWFWQTGDSSEAFAAAAIPQSPAIALPSADLTTTPALNAVTDSNGSQSADFLRQVANSFEQGQPSIGTLQIENHQFGSSLTGRGKFWCGGHGSRKSRLELIPQAENAKITQVCDGRFLYRLIESDEDQQLKFYNLEKLEGGDASLLGSSHPATWVGRGSVGGLLANLAEAFIFEGMKSSQDGQHVEIAGTWNADRLAQLMANWVDHRSIIPTTDWSKIPRQIPHGVRLRFTNSAGDWQPTEFHFFRFDAENKLSPTVPAMTVRFGPIQRRSIGDELFEIDVDQANTSDQTESYTNRLDILTGKRRVAEDLGDSIR